MKDVVKAVLLPWFHAYRFFVENVQRFESVFACTFVAEDVLSKGAVSNVMDRWILSAFQSLVGFVRTEMAAYRLYTVTPRLLAFIESLTNWYVRTNRRRFKSGKDRADTATALSTLFYLLFSLCKLMAPFTPFFVESLYQNLKAVAPVAERAGSIHYLDIPVEHASVKDEQVERTVGRMQKVVELGRTARNNRNLTLKQPLASLLLIHQDVQFLEDVRSLEGYVREEMNVREVTFSAEQERYISLVATPKRDVLGKKWGKAFPTLSQLITQLSSDQLRALQSSGEVRLTSPTGETWQVSREEVDVAWNFTGGEEQESVNGDDVLVVLDVSVSDDLREEGLVREVLREVQKMRKKAGLVATDAVEIYYSTEQTKAEEEVKEPVKPVKAVKEQPKALREEKVEEKVEEKKAEGKEVKEDKKAKKESKPKKEKTAPPPPASSPSPAAPATLDLDAVVVHQAPLILSTLSTPLRPAATKPKVATTLLTSSFPLLPTLTVHLQLLRPSVHLRMDSAAVKELDVKTLEGLTFWLACRQMTALRKEVQENDGVLQLKLDGHTLHLKEGTDFDL